MNTSLAIIVPAYKTRFLERALRSLEPLARDGAKLYVFDDASPEPVEGIVRQTLSGGSCQWHYHRFEQNLGGKALVKHYDRCIRGTTEPWVWLFSDDDVADAACARAFQRTVTDTRGSFDIYCFDSVAIDTHDQPMALHPPLPLEETWKQFAYLFFAGHRTVPQQAMIFARKAYEHIGGFVDFPIGWASDQATLLALAGSKGIRKIPAARIGFRHSGENISSNADRTMAGHKLQAAMQFLEWTLMQIDLVADDSFVLSDDRLRQQAFAWFRAHLGALHTWYAPEQCLQTAGFLSKTSGEPYLKALARMLHLDLRIATQALRGWLTLARR